MSQYRHGGEESDAPAFEQGPIRPPSEARSLLVRVTRNCPWNKCEFCPVYKGRRFTKRGVDEVKDDIRAMAYWTEQVVQRSIDLGFGGRLDGRSIPAVYQDSGDNPHMRSILIWMSGGAHTAFLQDADNLILKPEDLAEMLRFLRQTFPVIERVTSYSRSRTIAKRSPGELAMLREAGLNRVHVGLESGSDRVLADVKKGVTADDHIRAGRLVKGAGMELSEYVMPGLGGKGLWEDNARETARVLNAIDPDFIRLRSLGVGESMPLYQRVLSGDFEIPNDEDIAKEIGLFIESLDGIGSYLASDHVLNLLPDIEGRLPGDKAKMLAVVDGFLALPEEDRLAYIVGRRFGLLERVSDLEHPSRAMTSRRALGELREQGGDDIHATIRQVVARFI